MRIIGKLLISLSLLFGFGQLNLDWSGGVASAADGEPQIKDIIQGHAMLLDDGTIWSMLDGERMIRTLGEVVSVAASGEYGGLGITRDGKLVEWDIGSAPYSVDGQLGVMQVSGGYWVKNDGTVWGSGGKLKNLVDIKLIGYGNKQLAALGRNGDLLFRDPNKLEVYKKLATITNPDAVKSLAVYDSRVALLYESGKVVLYQTYEFDDYGNLIPFTVAEDAVHIEFAANTADHPTDALVVTRKDGTVWTTGNYKDRVKLTDQVPGLTQITKTSVLSDMEHFYAQRSDGSWLLFDEGDVKAIEVPRASQLTVTISDPKPFVGDKVEVHILETYTNGAEIKVTPSAENLLVEKPHLLRIEPDGSLKALGVGETKVTIESSSLSQTVMVSASLRSNLKFAKVVNGVVFLPSKSMIQALGGTVAASEGGFTAKVGDTSFSFKAKDKNAVHNGQPFVLNTSPFTEKGETFIPASLLTKTLGATVQWDAKWKQANISFGAAKMTVVSAETASLIKKAMQGSLAKYIGKSYWVNEFLEWERFSKVTVTDIVPDDSGSFVVVFKTAGGQKLQSYQLTSSGVSQLFNDGYNFLNYDPYKKYQWSSSVWNKIKAGHIDLGMTKEQVLFAWGEPSGKSTLKESGRTIETWVYANYDTVAFINGKVSVILN